jgi:hypothetical protein
MGSPDASGVMTAGLSPVIQLTRGGTAVQAAAADLSLLRDQFARQHYVRLPGFLEPPLLRFIQSEAGRKDFDEIVNEELAQRARNLILNGSVSQGMFYVLLMNDLRLFELIEDITGCGAIGSFTGRLYRMMPQRSDYASWHDDLAYHRLVAISINISTGVYVGGTLQIRNRESGVIISEVENTQPGDAVVFRLSPDLEHRVTEVSGEVPRTAYSGWFCAQPVFDRSSIISAADQPSSSNP